MMLHVHSENGWLWISDKDRKIPNFRMLVNYLKFRLPHQLKHFQGQPVYTYGVDYKTLLKTISDFYQGEPLDFFTTLLPIN